MALTKVKTGVVDDSVFAANKNVIINGNFDIWQRGTSFTTVSSNTYQADRFQWAFAGSGIVDVLQSTSVPDGLSDFSLQIDVTTADASIASGDIYIIRYVVEGYDALRFGFGGADAQVLTLSFWVRSPKTGIHCVVFQNGSQNRSYIVEYTVDVVDTWEYKTITITADTAGTWLTNNGRGIDMQWVLAAGTDFHESANTWLALDRRATSNQVNVMDNTANNFHLSRVQLEFGSTATNFERRSFATELSMAERYYEKSYNLATVPGTITNTGRYRERVVASHNAAIPYQTRKRTSPTVILYNPSTGATGTWEDSSGGAKTATVGSPGDHAFFVTITSPTVGSVISGHWTIDAEL